MNLAPLGCTLSPADRVRLLSSAACGKDLVWHRARKPDAHSTLTAIDQSGRDRAQHHTQCLDHAVVDMAVTGGNEILSHLEQADHSEKQKSDAESMPRVPDAKRSAHRYEGEKPFEIRGSAGCWPKLDRRECKKQHSCEEEPSHAAEEKSDGHLRRIATLRVSLQFSPSRQCAS